MQVRRLARKAIDLARDAAVRLDRCADTPTSAADCMLQTAQCLVVHEPTMDRDLVDGSVHCLAVGAPSRFGEAANILLRRHSVRVRVPDSEWGGS